MNKHFFSNGVGFLEIEEFATICKVREEVGLDCRNCKYFHNGCDEMFYVIEHELSRTEDSIIRHIFLGKY